MYLASLDNLTCISVVVETLEQNKNDCSQFICFPVYTCTIRAKQGGVEKNKHNEIIRTMDRIVWD